ncbi:MAG TPA: hypothetical protein ENJ08_16635 [Gammaproteobacteria bacterium]|nr:hypothetical protein [Gammaproteobacteria bacterium]
MNRYGGELVHQSSDEYGPIEIVDFQHALRCLHFGNKTQQSAMLLSNPFILVHKYAQAMMLPLSWKKPQRALILGLGSGSIARYLYNYCPELILDAVELRGEVIDIAKEYFLLPEQDKRFTVYHESAFDWLNNQQTETDKLNVKSPRTQSDTLYDMIFVDMFLTTEAGTDITINVTTCIDKLAIMLNNDGILILNQIGNSIHSYPALDALLKNFPDQLHSIDVETLNTIFIASRGSIPDSIDRDGFYDTEISYMLPFRNYFEKMNPVGNYSLPE